MVCAMKSDWGIVDAEWANRHYGETAIVIGNGESLNDVPKKFLESYITFGTNYIRLLPFQPTYYVCIDKTILENHVKQIYNSAREARTAFLGDGYVNGAEEIYQLNNVYLCNPSTVKLPDEKWWTGGTVTYMSLKIAYAMGFSTIVLVGCDWDKEWKHFSDEYIGGCSPYFYRKGQEYHLGTASIFYKKNGRRIVNLSPPSALDEYFERGRIEDW